MGYIPILPVNVTFVTESLGVNEPLGCSVPCTVNNGLNVTPLFTLLHGNGDGYLHYQAGHHSRVFFVDINKALIRLALEDVQFGEHVHRIPDHPGAVFQWVVRSVFTY